MKRFGLILLIISGFVLMNFVSCEEEEDYQDFYLVDIKTEVEDWDYLAFSKDGSSLMISDRGDGIPDQIYFTAEEDATGYSIFLDEDGYPEMAVYEDYIFLFSQVNNTTVDIAMISPDGEILITRDIETEIDWSEDALKSDESWGGVVRWAGRAASLAGCALSIKAAIATGGIAIPLAKWGCGAMVVSFAAQAIDADAVGLSSDVVGLGATLIGCPGDPVSCVIGIGSFVSGFIADALDEAENSQGTINAANGALMGGHGDVQVTLTWNNVADIDLHVIDPTGVEIYYANSSSPSGGQLDYDNTYAYGPENIFWPQGQAPEGQYQVYVNHYSGSSASAYTIVVNAFGHMRTFSGTVQVDQKVHVVNFAHDGIGTKSNALPEMVTNKVPK